MNKVHKSVWSAAVGTFVAAAETTRARGKKSRSAVHASGADSLDAEGAVDSWAAAPGPGECGNKKARVSKAAVMALAMSAGAALTPSISMADGASVKLGDGAVTDSNAGTGNSYVTDPITGAKTDLGMIDNLVAIGAGATATYAKNVAIGGNARAINGAYEGGYNTAIGDSALAQGDGSIRTETSVGQGFTTAIGGQSQALHDNTTAVGAAALANVAGATAVGMKAAATSSQALAVGNYSSAGGAGSIALGAMSNSTGASSVALGSTAISVGSGSVALGTQASALVSNSVALGAGSVAARNNSVSVGALNSERQITNVAAGSAGTDAVNLNQLNAAVASIGGSVTDAVQYDSVAHTRVSFGGAGSRPVALSNVAGGIANTDAVNVKQLKDAGLNIDTSGNVTSAFVAYDDTSKSKVTLGGVGGSPVTLTNVAAGQVTSTSKDAVNGSQLYGTASTVASALGGGTAVGTDGKLSKPAYALNGSTYTDVGAALAAVNAKAASGSADGVVYDTTAHNKVTFGGTGVKPLVTLANVAGGIANTDAVNVKQLKDAGLNIDTSGNVTSAFVAYDDTSKSKVTLGGVGGSPVTLTNLAAGQVTSTSKDAVNGSQLYKTASTVASALGGGTAVGTDGSVSKPAYSVSGNTYNDVGTALGAMGTAIDGINGTITNTTKYIKVVSNSAAALASGGESVAIGGGSFANATNSLAIGVGARATYANSMALGANSVTTETNTLSVGSKGGERRIVNVGDGRVPTDVATFGQLSTLQNMVNQQANVVRSTQQQESVVRSTLMVGAVGAATLPNYVVVSTNTTPGASTVTPDNALDAMAVGPGASAGGAKSLAIGSGAGTSLDGSTAVGSGAAALAVNTTVVGAGATTSNGASNAVAIGYNANVQNKDALAIGSSSVANATGSIAMGSSAFVTTSSASSMALGVGATASANNAVALGANSTADRSNSVSVGNSLAPRQIINVARGTMANDAVNVSQLRGVTNAIGGGAGVDSNGAITAPSFTVGGQTYTDVGSALGAITSGGLGSDSVKYDSSLHTRVTLGGTNSSPVTLTNVAAGVANADAVNVKQLKDLGASFDTSGNVTVGFVAYDDSTKNSITLKGASGSTKISGLTAGTLSSSSTEAVNGSQLFQTNQNVANVAGNVTNLNNVVNNITNTNVGIKYFHANSTLADSSATGTDAMAIGGNAKATAPNAVALGANAVANRINTVSVGASGAERQIVNVAAGSTNTDAVNLKQLKDLGASFDTNGNVTGGFVAYDDSTKNSLTLKGASGSTKISGLTGGTLSSSSTDAVNGSQLFQTNQNVANVAGNVTNLANVVNNITNIGTGIKYFHANSTLADSSATGTDAVAIGGNAQATANNSIALGASATTTANLNAAAYQLASGTLAGTAPVGEVSVGSAGKERRVTNVAAGSASTDAVNVSQLQAAVTSSSSVATADVVKYDSTAHNRVTLGGVSPSLPPVALTNLAAGTIGLNSRDAVNGAQIYGVSASVADALGGGASVSPSGTVTKPAYALGDQTYTDVGSALQSISSTVNSIDNTITQTTKYIKVVSQAGAAIASGGEAVAIGGGAYASAKNSLAIGAGARSIYADALALGSNSTTTVANTISVGAKGNERRIMFVADGSAPSDAVTFSQLSALQAQVNSQSNLVRSTLAVGAAASDVTQWIAVSSQTTGGLTTTAPEGENAMAIGPGATAMGDGSLAVGASSATVFAGSTAVGSGAGALSVNTTVIGAGATTSSEADNSVAIGYNANAQGKDALVLGSSAVTNAANSIAMGSESFVLKEGTGSLALGAGATASMANAVALGANSMADRANAVSVGSSKAQRQIINVAAGSADTDAVNVLQLNNAIKTVSGGGSSDSVVYDTSTHTSLTLGGAGTSTPVALTNVGAGQIASGSKDAVNGGQLYNTASSVAEALGGGSKAGADGTVSKPAYSVDGNTFNDVGAALAAVDAKAATGSANGVVYDTSVHDRLTLGGSATATPVTVTNVAAGVGNTDAVNVQQLKDLGAGFDSSGHVTGAFVAYDDTSKGKVTFGGTGASMPVLLTNVGGGQIASGSTDAINGSQLFNTASSVATALGGNSKAGADGKVSAPAYTFDGNTFNDVGSALAAVDAKASTGSVNGVVYDTSVHDKLTLGGASTNKPVVLTNVAAAKDDSDAVNLKQLKDAGINIDTSGNVTNAFVSYDNLTKGSVTFNAGSAPTQLKNVAAGTDLFDAVNVGQMQAYVTQNGGSGGTANAVAYDDSSKNVVTLGGTGHAPVTLTNVAAGTGATDAVNYSQFTSLESKVNNISTTGGSSTYVNINAAADATPAAASGTDAIAIGNGATANGNAAIAIGARTTTAGDNSVSLGAGSSAPATNAVALGANSVADRDNSVSVGTAGAERQLTNVAAGTQTTDAVNLGQLNNAMGGVQQQMHDIDRNAGKGIAAASALNIVTPYLPGRTTLNAGVANYRGYQAVGLGVSRWNEKGTINYNLGVSTSGGNSTIVRAGIGIVLGN